MEQKPKFLTPDELVERWGGAVSIGTLANWRSQGRGPSYVKFGRSVAYPVAELERWESENMQTMRKDGGHSNG